MANESPADPVAGGGMATVLKRLQSLGIDSPALTREMLGLGSRAVTLASGTLLQSEQDEVPKPQYLLAGCACRFRRLQVHKRLDVIGHVRDGRFFLPLTQEELADWTGLNPTHVNRVVQTLRRQGLASLSRGWVHLLDQARLADMAGSALTP